MDWITKWWRRDTRYYTAYLQQDLWGNWVVVQAWGKIGTKVGRTKTTPCNSYEDGVALLEKIDKRRQRHGYSPILTSDQCGTNP
ncbi:MAG: WGR domain-containing protein [Gammaproteobacteria bacterium]